MIVPETSDIDSEAETDRKYDRLNISAASVPVLLHSTHQGCRHTLTQAFKGSWHRVWLKSRALLERLGTCSSTIGFDFVSDQGVLTQSRQVMK